MNMNRKSTDCAPMHDGIEPECNRAVGPVSIGPISLPDAMNMAGLTREFSPLQVLPQAAAYARLPAAVLHTAWVSGLVSAGLLLVCGGRDPGEVEIVYQAPAYQGDRLNLEIWVGEKAGAGGKTVVAFEVRAAGRGLIAEGRALI